jgi:hypothetical protein
MHNFALGGASMKRSATILTAILFLGILLNTQVGAQDAPPANPYSGDIWKRSTLSADWGGLRNELAAKGVTLAGDMNEFAHGNGDAQFMNVAFNFNLIIGMTVPYSALATGVIVLPTKDPNEAIVNFLVFQSPAQASTSGFDDLDGNK